MKEILQEAVRMVNPLPEFVITGKVSKVDTELLTCDVLPSDGGAELFDVRLQAMIDKNEKGLFLQPKVGSEVLVVRIDDEQFFVAQFTEIDKCFCKSEKVNVEVDFVNGSVAVNIDDKVKLNMSSENIEVDAAGTITMNEGNNGGLVVSNSVAVGLNTLITRINILQTAYNTLVALYNAHLPLPTSPAVPLSVPPLLPTQANSFENPKVKH
jgi:hypothetical protein